MAPTPSHTPVMLQETLAYLAVRPGGTYIDATTGLGGHSAAIAEAMGPDGRLLCIDQDSEALEFARARLMPNGRRISFARGNFRDLAAIAADAGVTHVDGIVFDLGVSSMQLETAERGFAFGLEGPLDMRMDPGASGPDAATIANTWREADLAALFREFGETRNARRLARAIVAARPLHTTWELARAVEQVAGSTRGRPSTHPATKVFLALRNAVNRELNALESALPQARDLLGFGTPEVGGGRLVAISFHSLEDRIVKRFIRDESRDCLCPPGLPECRCGHLATLRDLARRGIRPGDGEVASNPRARSAVLRAAERIAV